VPFDLNQGLIVAAILFAASLIQGTVGFAMGLFGVPLLLMVARLTLPETVAVLLISAMIQNGHGVWTLRKRIEYAKTWRPIVIRFVTLPLGGWALFRLGTESSEQVKQLVGVVLLMVVVAMAAWRVKPRRQLQPAWEFPAFGLGGFLAGFCGMGGPPMVLWVISHRWGSSRSRGFLFFVFFLGLVPQIFFHVYFFGSEILWYFLLGLFCFPLIFAGSMMGLALGTKLPKRLLRKVTLGVLLAVALFAIISPHLFSQI
jgi:uncharacterized membrane protein YfcA